MNAAAPLSDDELWAPREALRYVKEALADMALSSIRREEERGGVMLLHCRRRSLRSRDQRAFLFINVWMMLFPPSCDLGVL